MFKIPVGPFDNMVLALATWLCTLPLIGLLILPFLGVKISLLVAAALLIGAVIVCRGVCNWKLFR